MLSAMLSGCENNKKNDTVQEERKELVTVEEFKELIDKCEWNWIGDGYAVTGPSKNSIKLPYLYTNFRETYRGTLADTGSFWSNEPSFDFDDYLLFFLLNIFADFDWPKG